MNGDLPDREPHVAGHWLGDLSRRAFLRRGTLTAGAVGVLASVPGLSGLLGSAATEAPALEADASETQAEVSTLSEPLVAHVRDLGRGEITLFRGTQEFVVRDPDLARRLLFATRP